ncbi:MAG: hypothetical protein AAF490_11235 [Chloroflexota bacterium]
MARQAMFAGLVYDEAGNLVNTKLLGESAQYVIDDDGFLRHIDSEVVDRQVLSIFLEQLDANRDTAVTQAMSFLGKDDIFTKAAIDSQLNNIDMDKILAQGLPAQARNMMGMLGFKIVINFHGDVVDFDQPALPDEGFE